MKSCTEINELLPLYIDNSLDENSHAEFEEHINNCETCKSEMQDIMQVIHLCKELPQEELPQDFELELHKKLVEVKEKEDRKNKLAALRNRYIKICSSVAACLLIIVFLRGYTKNVNFAPDKANTMVAQQTQQSDKADEKLSGGNSGLDNNTNKSYNFSKDSNGNSKLESKLGESPTSKQPTKAGAAPVPKSKDTKAASDSVQNGTHSDANITTFGGSQSTEASPPANEKSAEAAPKAKFAPDASATFSAAITSEVTANSSIGITINASNQDETVNKVKTYIETYGEKNYDSSDVLHDKSVAVQAEENDIVLSFSIENSKYEQFVNSLKSDFNSTDLEIGGMDNAPAATEEITGDSQYTLVTITIKVKKP